MTDIDDLNAQAREDDGRPWLLSDIEQTERTAGHAMIDIDVKAAALDDNRHRFLQHAAPRGIEQIARPEALR